MRTFLFAVVDIVELLFGAGSSNVAVGGGGGGGCP
jgi:hypothetical protein